MSAGLNPPGGFLLRQEDVDRKRVGVYHQREMLREGGDVIRQRVEIISAVAHVHVHTEQLSEDLTTEPYN